MPDFLTLLESDIYLLSVHSHVQILWLHAQVELLVHGEHLKVGHTIIRYMSASCVQFEVYQILHNVICNMYKYAHNHVIKMNFSFGFAQIFYYKMQMVYCFLN